MAKTLELQFLNTAGKTVKISVDSPVEPVDQIALNTAMDQLLAANIFISTDGEFVSKKGARIIDRNVTEITLG
ncbi:MULTISPECIES: DUF2922 domain-containing protein [Metabacillus]|uniref:DUF2922 domain-containing protein n=2 Tax=Metabacillus TaxID=2675233 RepID=A0A179T378_9BACI|nr:MULTISPECIES: DUF2922 domain-containing protein [Metabacillus]OAS87790.1 hypothetical protein A6K24_18810 [Metabacillus litoralis]QNF27290.1 DUF2922 domain-containing protein [Metabacillus sp. KUDC1714]